MSRPHSNENLNAVQLFPFVAVLLCTMGSLLVLLVAVARSSRNQAIELAAAETAASAASAASVAESPLLADPAATAAAPFDEEEYRRELEEARQYFDELQAARARAEKQLRDDRLRLSHVEDHIRRLREHLDELQLAAAELNAKKGDHYDDRQQAERELRRLEQLIAEARANIDALRAQNAGRPKAIAILPSERDDGTHRPPIYLECTADGVIMQPEGIRLVMQDFLGPLGPNLPLATAIRAAREHLVKKNPGGIATDATEPYALLIVRPGGVMFFHAACEVIERSGVDFGYELVDSDWDLRYPPPDPQLASTEAQAVEMARVYLRALASAAPGMYGDAGAVGGEPDGNGSGGGGAVPAVVPVRPRGGYMVVARRTEGDPKPSGASEGEASEGEQPPPPSSPSKTQAQGTQGDRSPPKEYLAGQMPNRRHPDPPPKPEEDEPDDKKRAAAQPRGEDWAIERMPGTVPVRRTVQVVVRADRLAILPQSGSSSGGREIVLRGSTDAEIDRFIVELQKHIEEWGIAGQGLAWRPVLALKVGPDGQRRADDLVRLLKHSGIEVQTSVAQHDSGEPTRANR